MCTTSVPGAQGGAQDVIEPLRLELQTAMYMGAGLDPGLAEPTLQPLYSLMAALWCLTGA